MAADDSAVSGVVHDDDRYTGGGESPAIDSAEAATIRKALKGWREGTLAKTEAKLIWIERLSES